MKLELGGQTLELLPDRAVWWPAEGALLVADVHLGKDQVFRRHGMAVPCGVLQRDLDRLELLLEDTGAERLIVLGDWVHAPPMPDDDWPDRIGEWRARHDDIAIDLVLGNHDRDLEIWLHQWQVDGHEECFELGGLALVHEWSRRLTGPGLSGHLHPGAVLKTRRERLRLPAFLYGREHLVLPAFGSFTGLMDEVDFPWERRFVTSGQRIHALPRA
ncbi:ligase-associated DNA damage response endonuclease PdeM [Wenzhouxiangella marina]|uniref:DEAD/DEAH box helicase n=1 Tax=Wenzhouxiangella marina TaxID=1579979 RepID=A0A0K0XUU0_9GAMM|nr:ligase-associated DNA damage response endonuclease PdeM [Wenzhouxiangella marina]AKS41386.1 DEAD/DEAH box helicase [Wenzhouxiangella marina]MBB6086860.1 DNA ligase-associated metallophosphoesterase [Wenzhouxiangella marina]